jgi:hypothetical protein
MRPRRWLAAAGCAALTALALALPGCGGGAPATPEKAGAQAGSGTGTVSSGADKPASGGAGDGSTTALRCPATLHRFAAGLESLRQRLVAGLTYAEYVASVKRLRASYATIAVDRLSPACLLAAGTPAERAFDLYIEAANAWGECLSEPGCDAADVEAPLQAEWKLAARQLDALRLR